MLVLDIEKLDTMICAHGRHGTNSLVQFAEFMNAKQVKMNSGGVKHSKEPAVEFNTNHLDRKIIVMTREPKIKFLSGLNHYCGFISDGKFPAYTPETRSQIFRASIKSMNRIGKWVDTYTSPRSPLYHPSGPVPYMVKNCARYNMGDSHMSFTGLSSMMKVNLGLDVHVMDIADLNDFYNTHDYHDHSPWSNNRVGIQPKKQEYYNGLNDMYMENIELIEEYHRHSTGSGYGSQEEFNALMDLEIQAYDILTSDDYVSKSRNFCRSLTTKIKEGSHLEQLFLSMSFDMLGVCGRLQEMVKQNRAYSEGLEINDELFQIISDQ